MAERGTSNHFSTTLIMESVSLQTRNLEKWRTSTFFVMLIGYIGYYLCRGNLSASFPLLNETFGYTNTELGRLAFYSELAYAAGKFINGPLGDRIGGRRIFLVGMVGTIFFNLVFSQGKSLVYFTIAWCCCRYFLSMGWGGLTKTLGAWYEPDKNGRVMGFVSISFQFGSALAKVFAGYLVARGVGWQGLFTYPAAVLALIWIWSIFASRATPQDVVPETNFGGITEYKGISKQKNSADTSVTEILSSLFSKRLFRLLLVYSFFTTLLRSIFVFWLPKFFVDLGLGTSSAIFKSTLFPLLGCLGTIGLGWYTDRYLQAGNKDRAQPMALMLIALVLCLLGIAVAVRAENVNTTLVLWLSGLCGFFLLGPYSMSSGCLTLDIAGSRGAGSCTGMLDGIGYIGGALSVWGAGKLSDVLGWSEVFVVLAIFALISTAAAFVMSREFRR